MESKIDKTELLKKIDSIIDEVNVGVLGTKDDDDQIHLRWMTPAFIKERQYAVYAITSPNFNKIKHLKKNEKVEWMIQTKSLSEILNIRGKINILDNPSIKTEIIEKIGKKFTMYWNINFDNTDFYVLETIIDEVDYFEPSKNKKTTIKFK